MTEKQELEKLVLRFPDFEKWTFCQQLEVIGWFLHTAMKKEIFTEADVTRCFDHLGIPNAFYLFPSQIDNCKNIVKRGYRKHELQYRVRARLDKQLQTDARARAIHELLKNLPAKVPIAEEKEYLVETLKCHQIGANRAAIVMAWNLAFSHLCYFILKDQSALNAFNQELQNVPKSTPITAYDDFSRLKESNILDICNTAKIISKNQYKILKDKLDRRNMAAHPSRVTITPIDTEQYIVDLINNLVLPLHIP
jgi:hypothetical protein